MPICAFCGKTVDVKYLTDDHIPPRGIFGVNPDYNLITVPSCQPCNQKTGKDDEYFKLLATEVEASETPVAESVNESTSRAAQRKDKPKFGNMIRSKMKFGEVYTEGGLYIGKHFTLKVDTQRILNTVEKIIRGLFFKHTTRALPAEYGIFCHLIPKVTAAISDESKAGWEMILSELGKSELVTVGPKVFRYRHFVSPDEPPHVWRTRS